MISRFEDEGEPQATVFVSGDGLKVPKRSASSRKQETPRRKVVCKPVVLSSDHRPVGTKVILNDGNQMPLFGLGTFRSRHEKCASAVCHALRHVSIRMIDTARCYGNEEWVAEGLKRSRIPREEVFLITKVPRDAMSYSGAIESCKKSLQSLKTHYIDLLLLHWPGGPSPNPRSKTHRKRRHEAWRAMVDLRTKGFVCSIGVSNFTVNHLRKLRESFPETLPAVNQVEVHPYLIQKTIRDYCNALHIHVQAYSPLARHLESPAVIYGRREADWRRVVINPLVQSLALKYGRSPAQICLRWALDSGLSVIPKSVTLQHIEENVQILFHPGLTAKENKDLESLDEGLHCAWDPSAVD